MSFECPSCTRAGSLVIQASIALPADVRSDEIFLQILQCDACGFRSLAIYEDSRREALGSDAWDHTGYMVSAALVDSVRKVILSCPAPGNPSCHCPTHQTFGQLDSQGRWQAPDGISGTISFPVRLSAHEVR